MSVNFTGIKNVGSMLMLTPNPRQRMNIISLQVNNDEMGNDLDEFNKAVEKTGNSKEFKTAYEGAVSVNVFTTLPEDEYGSPQHSFYLNGSSLDVNDENIPVFTYLAKLTRKIAKKEDKELGASTDYVQSLDFLNGSSIGYFVKQMFMANPERELFPIVNEIYKPANVKEGSKQINSAIHETMVDYLC